MMTQQQTPSTPTNIQQPQQKFIQSTSSYSIKNQPQQQQQQQQQQKWRATSFFSNLGSSSPALYLDDHDEDIRIKIYYSGLITVIYLKGSNSTSGANNSNNDSNSSRSSGGSGEETIEIDVLRARVREICGFEERMVFTMKWVDDEGDPCTIGSQAELVYSFFLR